MSQQQAPTHSRQSSGAQGQLQNVVRRDFEQSNVARLTSSSQHSHSRDDPAVVTATALPVRSDSTRQTPVRNGQHTAPHDTQDVPAAAPVAANGASSNDPATHQTSSSGVRRRTNIDATTGSWELGKTIGAGSMGKVKLAKNKATGEQVT